jgi:hypothetical protein
MQIPPANVLVQAANMALEQDKPIYLDYFNDSIEKTCCIGVSEDKTKILAKSQTDFTSPIEKIVKADQCFVVCTENSIYIVSADILVKKIT